jgi:hypothetical protein
MVNSRKSKLGNPAGIPLKDYPFLASASPRVAGRKESDTQYLKDAKQTWNAPNELMPQLSLALENINPGESYLISVKIKFHVPTYIQRAMADPSARRQTRYRSRSIPISLAPEGMFVQAFVA